MRPTALKAIDFESRFTQATYKKSAVVKMNKKAISKYERTLLKRELQSKIKQIEKGTY